MKPKDFANMDEFIDAALMDEPLREVPFAFHARVQDRLRVTKALQRERVQFKNRILSSFFVLTALVGIASSILFSSMPNLIDSVPGVLGHYDHFSTAVGLWGGGAFGLAMLAITAVALGLFALETGTMRKVRVR